MTRLPKRSISTFSSAKVQFCELSSSKPLARLQNRARLPAICYGLWITIQVLLQFKVRVACNPYWSRLHSSHEQSRPWLTVGIHEFFLNRSAMCSISFCYALKPFCYAPHHWALPHPKAQTLCGTEIRKHEARRSERKTNPELKRICILSCIAFKFVISSVREPISCFRSKYSEPRPMPPTEGNCHTNITVLYSSALGVE